MLFSYNNINSLMLRKKPDYLGGYCLITGASSGIGRGLVFEWASRGVAIIAVAHKEVELLVLKKDVEENFSVPCVIFPTDLTNVYSAEKIFIFCKKNSYKVQILINNVGVGSVGEFQDSTIDFDLNLVRLNVFPMLQLVKLFLPDLKSFKSSFVLNMASLGVYSPVPYKALYTASKSFVYTFSKALHTELKHYNINVSVSCPAGVYTNKQVVKRIKQSGKIGRWTSLHVDDVSSYIVGSMLAKKTVIIPGIGAKILFILLRIMPEIVNRWFLAKNMKKS